MSNQNIRTREKITSLITVLLIWGICTLVCLHFYLGSQTKNFTSHKELIIKKSERQEKLHSDQLAYNKLCDSLNARIGRFDPSVNASFEESDIKFMISDLKDMYEKNAWDFRYKVFYHTAQFYDMWFADKKILWSKQSNVARFRTNLEQCEMGLTRKEDVLNQIQNTKLNE